MLLLGSMRVSAVNFINTEVSQKYWDEAVKVVRTHEAGSRSHFYKLIKIIFTFVNISISFKKLPLKTFCEAQARVRQGSASDSP